MCKNKLAISIKQRLTLVYLEELYHVLDISADFNQIDLKLPTKIGNTDFSIFVSFLQFISTWVRTPNSGNLILPEYSLEEYELYLNQEFVFPIIVLSWEKDIINTNGDKLKSNLKFFSQKYFQKMEYLELKNKESIPVYSFDHDLSNRGLSRFYYNSNKKVVSEEQLDFNLYPAFEKLGNYYNKKVFKDSIRPVLEDFIKITHELFLNTHEHARTDINGNNLYPNVRCSYFKFYKRTLKKYKEEFKDIEGLKNYFDSNLPLNDKSELYLFEISIMDSGPGLARRFGNVKDLNSVSIYDEVELIKKCLFKHNTSAASINKSNKGLGLNRVLETIDGKGFIRIRSGRTSLFRDMRNFRHIDAKNPSEILLDDWQNLNKDFITYSNAEGTVISIIYPLGL